MILDSTNAEAASQLVSDSGWDSLGAFAIAEASLAGVVDLARVAFRDGPEAGRHLDRALRTCPEGQAINRDVLRFLAGEFEAPRPRSHLFSRPAYELWMIDSWASVEDDAFQLYLQRFERGLRSNGFGNRFPKALTQAFMEMVENVVRHSSPASKPAIGVVGYHVSPNAVNFVVADLGRGVKASLSGNPAWQHLSDERSALVAAARDGATRLAEEEHGFGFKRVFKAFLEREGVLALRSGDGAAVFRGNADRKVVETCSCAYAPGLRVAASLSTSGKAREIPL